MNMEPNISNPGSPPPVPALPNESQTRIATRPLYWSVLRELWENESIYIAPAIVAAVLLAASPPVFALAHYAILDMTFTAFLFGDAWGAILALIVFLVVGWLWFVLPLAGKRRARVERAGDLVRPAR